MCSTGIPGAWLWRCGFGRHLIWFLMILGVSQLLPTPAFATSITWSIVPFSLTVTAGQTASADVVIAGKPAGRPPSVGAFDFTVTFNPAILSPTGITFGPFLGNPSIFEALTAFSFSTGSAEFAEVSLLTPAQLDALQPSSFKLATVSFNALSSGNTALLISQATVDDAFGNKIPEPGTLLLLGSGLAVSRLQTMRRRREKHISPEGSWS